MAQLAVQLAFTAAGNFLLPGIGGQIGAAVGGYVGAQLFGPKAPDTEGPRLSDLTVQSATEGADMALLWGAVRIPAMVIWADKKREIAVEEETGGKGGSSPTYTSYTYTLNFAVSFGKAGDGASCLLRRVWANKKLIYDATSGADAVASGYSFKFYDGTQTAADPIVESVVGTGNAPAYKKQILLVGYAWNLSKEFGNRLPQIEAEIVTNGTESNSVSTILTTTTTHASTMNQAYSAATDSLWMGLSGNGGSNFAKIVEVDMSTQTVLTEYSIDQNSDVVIMPYSPSYELNNERYALVYKKNSGGTDTSDIVDLRNNLAVLSTITHGGNDSNFYKIAESEAFMFVGSITAGTGANLDYFDKAAGTLTAISPPTGHTYIEDAGGIYIANDGITFGSLIVPLERTSDSVIIWAVYDGSTFDTSQASATRTDTNSDIKPGWILADDGDIYIAANFIAGTTDPYLIRLNTDGSEVEEIDLSADYQASSWPSASGTPYIHYVPEQRAIYFNGAQYVHRYLIDAQTVEKWNTSTTISSWPYFDVSTSLLFTGYAAAGVANIYAIRVPIVNTAAYGVDDILDDLSQMVGVTSGMRDWTGVTETVGGFVHTKTTSAASDMQPLLTYSLADAVASGWKVKGVEFGGSSVDTIDSGTTVAGNRVKRTKPHDIRLPNISQTQYMSSDADMQPGMASFEWYTAPGNQTTQLSFPITLSDSEAVAFNAKYLQLSYNLQTFEFQLPPMYLALEPGDPITLIDGTRVKLTEVNRGYNGVLECRAVSDNVADLTVSVATPGASVDNATIPAASTPRLYVIDTPLLRDVDNDHPGPYLAAFTFGDDDPGIAVHVSADNAAFSSVATISTEPIVGTVDTVPSSVDWEDYDTTNTIRVRLKTGGTLASATDAELLAGANAAVWGSEGVWEVMQWKTATLISAGVYDLSNLLRGRRGTDGFIDGHAADDWFIVPSITGTVRNSLQNADIGSKRYYKATKAGQAISDVTSDDWTVGTNPLRPYSPISPTDANNGSDVDLGWTRRTRKGGSYGGANTLTDGVGGPISEDSESYDVEILDSTGTVLSPSPYTVTTNSRKITAAELTACYGSTPPTLFWRVRQNSAVSGVEGFPLPDQTHYITTPAEITIDGLSPNRFWKLDEDTGTTAADAEGNADLTYNNTPSLNQPTLTTIGTSVRLDAASSENITGTSASSVTNGSTAWSVVLFCKHDDTSADNIFEIGTSGNGFKLYTDSSQGLVAEMFTAASVSNTAYGTSAIAQDTGYAIAVTFGNGGSGNYFLRLYVDGSEVDNHDFGSSTIYITSTNITVGFNWDGFIDCVAEWQGTELTSTNVSDIAAANAENF